jgi:hypothetical protein
MIRKQQSHFTFTQPMKYESDDFAGNHKVDWKISGWSRRRKVKLGKVRFLGIFFDNVMHHR